MKTICEQIPESTLRPVSKQTALCVGAVLRDTLARRHPEAITEGRRRLLGDEVIMVYTHASRTLVLSAEELLEVEADGGQNPHQQFEELRQRYTESDETAPHADELALLDMKTALAAHLVQEEYLETYYKPPAELDYEIMKELEVMAGSVLSSAHESLQTTKQLTNA